MSSITGDSSDGDGDIRSPWRRYLSLVTVEPTMMLYMMAFMTTSVVEQAFFVHKACTVDHGYDEEICDRLHDDQYKEENKIVQATVSTFHQWNDITGHLPPILLALFMGSWSDRRGRRAPLLLGLLGKFYYSTLIVVNSTQPTWPLSHIITTATLPQALTGADVAIFGAAFAYIADVTRAESRTLRVTVLEVCYLVTMPTGIALGQYLFTHVSHRSYTFMFSLNATLLLLSLLYTLLRLHPRTTSSQQPLPVSAATTSYCCCSLPLAHLRDFFQLSHARATLATLYRRRASHRRRYLLLLIVAMGAYTFQRDEKQNSYLYWQLVLSWPFERISEFRTAQSAVQAVGLLVAVPLMSRYLGWRDTLIIMVGAAFHSIARVFYATANVTWMVYLGGAFASLGPIVAPVIRSMISKLVAPEERGKAFAILSCADNAIPVLSGIAYNQVYQATIHTHPQAIFYVTIVTQMIVFSIALFIQNRVSDVTELIHVAEVEAVEKCLPNPLTDSDEEKASL